MLALKSISSLEELLASRAAWDDLWRRSDVTWPTMQAELLAQWIEQFAADRGFRALVVEDSGVLVAALPTIDRPLARVVKAAGLPGNEWSPLGDLLLDPDCNVNEVLDLVVRGLAQSRTLAWFDAVNARAPRWQGLIAAAERVGMATHLQPRGDVALVDLSTDWNAYKAGRSRNHRRHLKVAQTRAEKAGGAELELILNPPVDELRALLQRGFEVEDRSWKARSASSVLRSPGMFEFYVRQATELSRQGQLALAYLTHRGAVVAFEYAWLAKGVLHPLKVGYDETFAELTPGQLLRTKLLEQLHTAGQCRLIDYLGPITPATAKWSTRTYTVSRLAIALGGPLSHSALRAACHWAPRLKAMRQRWKSPQLTVAEESAEANVEPAELAAT